MIQYVIHRHGTTATVGLVDSLSPAAVRYRTLKHGGQRVVAPVGHCEIREAASRAEVYAAALAYGTKPPPSQAGPVVRTVRHPRLSGRKRTR
jgi:hypothetical protein